MGQIALGVTLLHNNLAFGGMEFVATHHRNFFVYSGIDRVQIDFHLFSMTAVKAHPRLIFNSKAEKYALFIENLPFSVKAQISLSSWV